MQEIVQLAGVWEVVMVLVVQVVICLVMGDRVLLVTPLGSSWCHVPICTYIPSSFVLPDRFVLSTGLTSDLATI